MYSTAVCVVSEKTNYVLFTALNSDPEERGWRYIEQQSLGIVLYKSRSCDDNLTRVEKVYYVTIAQIFGSGMHFCVTITFNSLRCPDLVGLAQ